MPLYILDHRPSLVDCKLARNAYQAKLEEEERMHEILAYVYPTEDDLAEMWAERQREDARNRAEMRAERLLGV